MTTQEEIWIIEKFLRLYTKRPIENLTKEDPPAPDFIADSLNEKIGIELTEVFQDSNTGVSKLQQYSSDANSFTNELITSLQPYLGFTFAIGIHFSKFHPVKKSKRRVLIDRLVELCVPEMLNLSHQQRLNLDYYNGLPEEINNIHIYRYDNLDSSFNSKPEGGAVSDLTIAHIQPILINKEQKMKKYLPCDQYWLIIREGNYYAGSFSELNLTLPLMSSFSKIFLLRTRNDDLIELK